MSHSLPYDPANIFTKIIAGDIPSVKLYEDEHTLAFMDVFPQSEGHALIISKTAQSSTILDMPEDALKHVIHSTQIIARAVNNALAPDGIRLMQFNGAAAGQTVFHTHFHVIPVYEGKAQNAHASTPADPQILESLAQKIREAL